MSEHGDLISADHVSEIPIANTDFTIDCTNDDKYQHLQQNTNIKVLKRLEWSNYAFVIAKKDAQLGLQTAANDGLYLVELDEEDKIVKASKVDSDQVKVDNNWKITILQLQANQHLTCPVSLPGAGKTFTIKFANVVNEDQKITMGDVFLKYDPNNPPSIDNASQQLQSAYNQLLNQPLQLLYAADDVVFYRENNGNPAEILLLTLDSMQKPITAKIQNVEQCTTLNNEVCYIINNEKAIHNINNSLSNLQHGKQFGFPTLLKPQGDKFQPVMCCAGHFFRHGYGKIEIQDQKSKASLPCLVCNIDNHNGASLQVAEMNWDNDNDVPTKYNNNINIKMTYDNDINLFTFSEPGVKTFKDLEKKLNDAGYAFKGKDICMTLTSKNPLNIIPNNGTSNIIYDLTNDYAIGLNGTDGKFHLCKWNNEHLDVKGEINIINIPDSNNRFGLGIDERRKIITEINNNIEPPFKLDLDFNVQTNYEDPYIKASEKLFFTEIVKEPSAKDYYILNCNENVPNKLPSAPQSLKLVEFGYGDQDCRLVCDQNNNVYLKKKDALWSNDKQKPILIKVPDLTARRINDGSGKQYVALVGKNNTLKRQNLINLNAFLKTYADIYIEYNKKKGPLFSQYEQFLGGKNYIDTAKRKSFDVPLPKGKTAKLVFRSDNPDNPFVPEYMYLTTDDGQQKQLEVYRRFGYVHFSANAQKELKKLGVIISEYGIFLEKQFKYNLLGKEIKYTSDDAGYIYVDNKKMAGQDKNTFVISVDPDENVAYFSFNKDKKGKLDVNPEFVEALKKRGISFKPELRNPFATKIEKQKFDDTEFNAMKHKYGDNIIPLQRLTQQIDGTGTTEQIILLKDGKELITITRKKGPGVNQNWTYQNPPETLTVEYTNDGDDFFISPDNNQSAGFDIQNTAICQALKNNVVLRDGIFLDTIEINKKVSGSYDKDNDTYCELKIADNLFLKLLDNQWYIVIDDKTRIPLEGFSGKNLKVRKKNPGGKSTIEVQDRYNFRKILKEKANVTLNLTAGTFQLNQQITLPCCALQLPNNNGASIDYYQFKLNDKLSIVQQKNGTDKQMSLYVADKQQLCPINTKLNTNHDNSAFILPQKQLQNFNTELQKLGVEYSILPNGQAVLSKSIENNVATISINKKLSIDESTGRIYLHKDISSLANVYVEGDRIYVGDVQISAIPISVDISNGKITFKSLKERAQFNEALKQHGLVFHNNKICTFIQNTTNTIGTGNTITFKVDSGKLQVIKKNGAEEETKTLDIDVYKNIDGQIIIVDANDEKVIQQLENNCINIYNGVPYSALPIEVKPLLYNSHNACPLQNENGDAFTYMSFWEDEISIQNYNTERREDDFYYLQKTPKVSQEIDGASTKQQGKLVLKKSIMDHDNNIIPQNETIQKLVYDKEKRRIVIAASFLPNNLNPDKTIKLKIRKQQTKGEIIFYGNAKVKHLALKRRDNTNANAKPPFRVAEYNDDGTYDANNVFDVEATFNYDTQDGDPEVTLQFKTTDIRNDFATKYGLTPNGYVLQKVSQLSPNETVYYTTIKEFQSIPGFEFTLDTGTKSNKLNNIKTNNTSPKISKIYLVDYKKNKSEQIYDLKKKKFQVSVDKDGNVEITFSNVQDKNNFIAKIETIKKDIQNIDELWEQKMNDQIKALHETIKNLLASIRSELQNNNSTNLKKGVDSNAEASTRQRIKQRLKNWINNQQKVKLETPNTATAMPQGVIDVINKELGEKYNNKFEQIRDNIINNLQSTDIYSGKTINNDGEMLDIATIVEENQYVSQTYTVGHEFITLLQTKQNNNDTQTFFHITENGNSWSIQYDKQDKQFKINSDGAPVLTLKIHNGNHIILSGTKSDFNRYKEDAGLSIVNNALGYNIGTPNLPEFAAAGLLYIGEHIIDGETIALVYNKNTKQYATGKEIKNPSTGEYKISGVPSGLDLNEYPELNKLQIILPTNEEDLTQIFMPLDGKHKDINEFFHEFFVQFEKKEQERKKKEAEEEQKRKEEEEKERQDRLKNVKINEVEEGIEENEAEDIEETEEERIPPPTKTEEYDANEGEEEYPPKNNKYANNYNYDVNYNGPNSDSGKNDDQTNKKNSPRGSTNQNGKNTNKSNMGKINNAKMSNYIPTSQVGANFLSKTTLAGQNETIAPMMVGGSSGGGGPNGSSGINGSNTPQRMTTNTGGNNNDVPNEEGNNRNAKNEKKSYAPAVASGFVTAGGVAVAVAFMNNQTIMIVGSVAAVLGFITAIGTGINAYSHNKKINPNKPNTSLDNKQPEQSPNR